MLLGDHRPRAKALPAPWPVALWWTETDRTIEGLCRSVGPVCDPDCLWCVRDAVFQVDRRGRCRRAVGLLLVPLALLFSLEWAVHAAFAAESGSEAPTSARRSG
ncbi:hypothetical protein GCM10010207_66020 [Streptomyces atratus]|nr:hypothetical protein GCM10010207_66020 [Streptomyces atratus]